MTTVYENQENISSEIFFTYFSRLESLEYTAYKHMYVDICDGDLVSGILLSKILYWFGVSEKDGKSRARHIHNGRLCIVKKHEEWWEECRISLKQVERVVSELKKLGFISIERHKSPFHNMELASFIFIDKEKIVNAITNYLKSQGGEALTPFRGEGKPPNGVKENPEKGATTYITITTDNNYKQKENTCSQKISKEEKKKAKENSKKSYAEFVRLTEDEYNKLLNDNEKDKLDWMIHKLNSHKGSKGAKYDSDYMTMVTGGWVQEAYGDQTEKKGKIPIAITNISQAQKNKLESIRLHKEFHSERCSIYIMEHAIKFLENNPYQLIENIINFNEHGFIDKTDKLLRKYNFQPVLKKG